MLLFTLILVNFISCTVLDSIWNVVKAWTEDDSTQSKCCSDIFLKERGTTYMHVYLIACKGRVFRALLCLKVMTILLCPQPNPLVARPECVWSPISMGCRLAYCFPTAKWTVSGDASSMREGILRMRTSLALLQGPESRQYSDP
jgi:hypothetical protein